MAPNPTAATTARTHEDDLLSDSEEHRVLSAAISSFRNYRQAAHYNITHLRRQSFYALPSTQIDLLSGHSFDLPQIFDRVDDAIDANADIAEAIVAAGLPAFGIERVDRDGITSDANFDAGRPSERRLESDGLPTLSDMDKARSTIRQLYRDWSVEGAAERAAAFDPIMTALVRHLPPEPSATRHRYHILVPGAGLGRLVFDLVLAGYTVEGNEISYHQLLASNYMLNCITRAGQHSLYPWALNFSNHYNRNNQLRHVAVPDISPVQALQTTMGQASSEVHFSERMSMSAGDFCSLYRQPSYAENYTAVVTCFFIDTAPNLIHYVEAVRNSLAIGGLWINLGPLLWHFEAAPTPAERERQRQRPESTDSLHFKTQHDGIGEPGSFELTNDEVIRLVTQSSFDVIERSEAAELATGYIQDPHSMLQNIYRPSFWVARKRSST